MVLHEVYYGVLWALDGELVGMLFLADVFDCDDIFIETDILELFTAPSGIFVLRHTHNLFL